MQYYKVDQSNIFKEVKKNIEHGKHTCFHVVTDKPVVFVNHGGMVDANVCENLGYETCEAQYNGGIIISNQGDFAIAHFSSICNPFKQSFVEHFVNWLQNKGLNAVYEDNDILIDGYKVCGTSTTRYGRIDFTAIFIGVNTNLEHIKTICKKPMVKVPKGLSEYGITTEEIEALYHEFRKEYNKHFS